MGPRQLLPVYRRGGESRGILRCAFSRSSRICVSDFGSRGTNGSRESGEQQRQEVTSDAARLASPAGRPLVVSNPTQQGFSG